MIKLPQHISPSVSTLDSLRRYQVDIDAVSTFEERADKAGDLFTKRNKKGNRTFDDVKECLTQMCSGARRCAYCEDSVADEVEHIYPKALYPSLCFDWDNYLYACGNCNGPKNNKFAVFRFDDGEFQEVNSPKGTPQTEPPPGEFVLINPRKEDAMEFFMLDIADTFMFVSLKDKATKEAKRVEYTLEKILKLNEREFLRKARANAYDNYKNRLGYYSTQKNGGASQEKLDKMVASLKSESHPTVWKEMQRQYELGFLKKIDEELDSLFEQSPEALLW